MTDKIPIVAAETIGKNYRYDQVVIYARRVGDIEWVTTWGKDRTHCDVAARIGETIRNGVIRPLEAKDAEITRLKALVGTDAEREEAEDMADVGRSLMEAVATVTDEGSILAGWHPAEDPAEIVTDMYEMLRQASHDIAQLKAIGETAAVRDVLAMRRRQVERGYDAAHDDGHRDGEIISGDWGAIRRLVGAASWLKGATVAGVRATNFIRRYRELLIDGATLALAEIERLDRIDPTAAEPRKV